MDFSLFRHIKSLLNIVEAWFKVFNFDVDMYVVKSWAEIRSWSWGGRGHVGGGGGGDSDTFFFRSAICVDIFLATD